MSSPTKIATCTVFSASAEDSRSFRAKFSGVCAWTGARFFAGDEVRYYGEGLVSSAAVARWGFGYHSAKTGESYGGYHSNFERVGADVDAALTRALAGVEVEVIAGNGYTTYLFKVSGGRFLAPYGKADKSAVQMRALLAKASAFRVLGPRATEVAA